MRKNGYTAQQKANARQAAIRKIARRLRKSAWLDEHEPRLYRDKYIGFDARLSGPLVAGVPRLTEWPLTDFVVEATEIFERVSENGSI